VINGDLATKLAAYRARIDDVPEAVSRFLEFLPRSSGRRIGPSGRCGGVGDVLDRAVTNLIRR
jgi:hypothetical protein